MVSRDCYSKLGSEVVEERIEAATSLIQDLKNEDNASEWDYALTRLMKGLITTRQSAKIGFSMALTEVVHQLINDGKLTVEQYLTKLEDVTRVRSQMKGKEERAVLFGRLFGLQVLLSTGCIFRALHYLARFVTILVELAGTKSWIREVAFATLVQVITEVPAKFKDEILVSVLQSVNDLGLNLSTEGLAVYLNIDRTQRTHLAGKIKNPKTNWKNGDPLRKGNLPVLAKVLKDAEVVDPEAEDTKSQKGSWSPRLPFVWNLIVKNFTSGDEFEEEGESPVSVQDSKKRKKMAKVPDHISFKDFYTVVVDESLFAEKSSHERKYWGFMIFMRFLPGLGREVKYLFTPNFMRCLINQASHKSRILHGIARETLDFIPRVCVDEPEVSTIVLKQLLDESKGGCWNFDLISKSHTIDGILSKPNDEMITFILEKFDNALKAQDVSEGFKNSNDNVLKWCLDKLMYMVKKKSDLANLQSIFDLLIELSLFETTASPQIRKCAQEKLNSLLSEVMTQTFQHKSWSFYCYQQILSLEKSRKCLVEFDDELIQVKQQTIAMISTIESLCQKRKKKTEKEIVKSSDSDTLEMFELLFTLCFIQLYSEDEEIVQILSELTVVFEKQFSGADEAEAETEDESNPSVIMTEIILSFISRKSNLLKKLSLTVWEKFLCVETADGQLRLDDACFQLLLDVLVARENKEGQQSLFEGDGEFVDEEDDSVDSEAGNDGDENEDEEMEEENEEDGSDEAEEDEEEEDEEEEDEEEEEESDEEIEESHTEANTTMTDLDRETNLKLAKALGIPTRESGEVKFDELSDLDSSNDDYESDSMDDEQMMAMDDQLSKIFKERQDILKSVTTGNKRKAEVMEAKENMIFFKNRVLDLLEVFTRIHPDSFYNLKFIEPVITLINLTLDKNLGVKAHKYLKTRLSKTKLDPSKIRDVETVSRSLLEMIEKLQDSASTTKSSNLAVLASYNQACIILAKNLVFLDSKNLEAVVDIYASSLKKWALSDDSRLQPSLFFDFVNWIRSKKK
ncbi:uncharacterized protein LODBEIA_P52900 [Lodderomyces beijingensis]|uniref:DNA polymerase V n=1 Tax=Lodderomyces beijingensis TaxID=1775926 RepID=A0ABP0ZSF9_9ASCO